MHSAIGHFHHSLKTAKRELHEECGNDLRVYYYGNVPMFHTSYLFDKDSPARELYKCDGTQLFFFPALYLSGEIELDESEIADFGWYSLDEVNDLLPKPIASRMNELFWLDVPEATDYRD